MAHANTQQIDSEVILAASPPAFPRGMRMILWALVLLGAGRFFAALSTGSSRQMWVLFQVNTIYWFSLAAAAGVLCAGFCICDAAWARPVRRLLEAAASFLPISVLPFVIMYLFGYEQVFGWATEEIHGKERWLNPRAVFLRDFIAISLLVLLIRRFTALSLGADFAAAQGSFDRARWQKALRESSALDAAACLSGRKRLAPLIVVVYAAVMSLVAFDQVMSVDSHWYSTLFGAFVFMSAIYLAVSWVCALLPWLALRSDVLRVAVSSATLHDLGKLMFGFGIFWAYLFWSHYLTIWYGNLPEETMWLIPRLRLEPWHSFGWLILGCCFIYPFLFGLSRDAKQLRLPLSFTAAVVMIGLWLQCYMLIAPTLFPHEIPLSAFDLFLPLGFGALFMLAVSAYLEQHPLIPFADRLVKDGD